MKKSNIVNKGFVTVAVFIAGVLPAHSQTPLAGATRAESHDTNFGILIDGSAGYKEQGWTNFAPAVFGAVLYLGDVLQVEEGAHVKIVCSDLTIHDLRAGLNGIPCSTNAEVLRSIDGSLINPTRSRSYDGSYPLILSPRRTKLLSPNPKLRWTPVSGAKEYSIKIRSTRTVWSRRCTGTEIEYPFYPLEPGETYKLIVEGNGETSSSEPGEGLGFSVLPKNDADLVRREEAQIRALALPTGTNDFLIAHMYAAHDLNAEAIDRLETLSKTFKVAAVQRLLGDLYKRVGLPRQAETYYIQSLELAISENDQVGQMKAHLALAEIYQKVLGNGKAASEQISLTLALASKIGDDRTIRQAGLLQAEVNKGGS